MDNVYKVKYKKGNLEIEVESSDKNYVDKKLSELIEAEATTDAKPPAKRQSPAGKKKTNPAKSKQGNEKQDIDFSLLVDEINEADNHEEIDNNILSNIAQLPRVLMCLYFAKEHLTSHYLTTGHIQTITDRLGVKIKYQNVGRIIKKNPKYFSYDKSRKPGTPTPYKLNKKGVGAYKTFLKGKE